MNIDARVYRDVCANESYKPLLINVVNGGFVISNWGKVSNLADI